MVLIFDHFRRDRNNQCKGIEFLVIQANDDSRKGQGIRKIKHSQRIIENST